MEATAPDISLPSRRSEAAGPEARSRKRSRGWTQLLDLFLPERTRDLRTRSRRRKTVFFTLCLVVWGPVFAVVYHLLGAPRWIVLMLFGVCALALPVLWFCRRGASGIFMAGWLGANLLGIITALAIFSGGSSAPATWWIALLPLIGVGLGGRRMGVALALLGALLLATIFFADSTALLPPSVLDADALLTLHTVGQVGLLMAICALAFTTSTFEAAAHEALCQANLRLAREIEARSAIEARLNLAQQRLLLSAHRAGMAQTAAAVLHDVGNALNSVTVSASTLEAEVRALRLDGVPRARARLKEARGSAEFRIGKVVPYLEALERILEQQRRDLLAELESLRRDAIGVHQVIKAQNRRALRNGKPESCSVAEAVKEVLQIERRALAGAQISVACHCDALATLRYERTPLLQIVMNLVSNARDAVRDAPQHGGHIEISGWTGSNEVGLRVCDDGIGVDLQLQDQIFDRGFTTKAKGHGLGLHAASLAAKQLGATLQCESLGAGHGATFTLRLPRTVQKQEARARPSAGAAA